MLCNIKYHTLFQVKVKYELKFKVLFLSKPILKTKCLNTPKNGLKLRILAANTDGPFLSQYSKKVINTSMQPMGRLFDVIKYGISHLFSIKMLSLK